MPLSTTTIDRLKKVIGPQYERDVKELLSARHTWKKTRDVIEVASKILSGLGSIVAFGASSVKDPVASDWMAFGSGCIGTLALTLMLFSSYSGRVSRQRTRELNNVLRVIGVTPVAQIASSTDAGDSPQELEEDADIETAPSASTFDASLLKPIKRGSFGVSE
jgi:hypothetical protein